MLFVFQMLFLNAQNDSTIVNEEKYWYLLDSIDGIKEDSIELAHLNSSEITIETNYTNKVVFRGRDFGLQQYGFYNSIKYKNPSGFYLNLNNYSWSGVQTLIAKTDLGIGFEKNITKRLSFDVSYERWFLSNDTFFLAMNFNNMLQTCISTNYEKLNGEASVYFIFGSEIAFLYDLKGTYNIDLPGSNYNFSWSLMPSVLFEIYAGQKHKSDTTNFISNNIPYREIKTKYTLQKPQLANSEILLELNLYYKNLAITPTFHYAFPLVINYEDEPLSPYLANGYSYFTLNIAYNFYFKSLKHVN